MKLFLGGDLMVARGVDQILPWPVEPTLYESYVRDARDYVRIAERRNGAVTRGAELAYPWGDALEALDEEAPDVRIANLETSITDRGEPDAVKGIHYRVSPRNAAMLAVARLDVCTLANNHVLDWGPEGLADTLATLTALGIRRAGAGPDEQGALAPAVVVREAGRVVVLSVATDSSGVPSGWAATPSRAGVARLPDLSDQTADAVAERVAQDRRQGDVAVVSIHWGPNWGYQPHPDEIRFAHRLVEGGVDLVHGHSAHHPRPVEVYRDRLILYGCGELLDDYEGIRGHAPYRPELVLLWFPTLGADGALVGLRTLPMQIRRLRLERAAPADAAWLADTLRRICRPFDRSIALQPDGALVLG